MKKTILCLIMVLTMLLQLSACENNKDFSSEIEGKNESDYEIDSNDKADSESVLLLTKEELIRLCNLSEEEYVDKDLDAFIDEFKLTKENVYKLNIHLILSEYEESRNVEYLFEDTAEARTSDFTKDAVCIAFTENINTTINCVYIDAKEKEKWAHEYEYIFWNLDSYESEPISSEDIDNMLAKFDEWDVFSLKDKADNASITDPMSFSFVVEYEDGSRFEVSRSGRASKILPDFYDEWREMLFS